MEEPTEKHQKHDEATSTSGTPHTTHADHHLLASAPPQEPPQAHMKSLHEGEMLAALPTPLKAGIEGLSGLSMDDVTVHYNSGKPAEMQALAYTQGSEIYLGPGQERHLAHE